MFFCCKKSFEVLCAGIWYNPQGEQHEIIDDVIRMPQQLQEETENLTGEQQKEFNEIPILFEENILTIEIDSVYFRGTFNVMENTIRWDDGEIWTRKTVALTEYFLKFIRIFSTIFCVQIVIKG